MYTNNNNITYNINNHVLTAELNANTQNLLNLMENKAQQTAIMEIKGYSTDGEAVAVCQFEIIIKGTV